MFLWKGVRTNDLYLKRVRAIEPFFPHSGSSWAQTTCTQYIYWIFKHLYTTRDIMKFKYLFFRCSKISFFLEMVWITLRTRLQNVRKNPYSVRIVFRSNWKCIFSCTILRLLFTVVIYWFTVVKFCVYLGMRIVKYAETAGQKKLN